MNRVRSERNLKKWTQVELAEKVGVDASTIIRWEQGGQIPQDKVLLLRELFGCSIDWILGATDARIVVT